MSEYTMLADWVDSPYYQLLSSEENKGRTDFINDLLAHLQPAENSKLLNAACNTGKVCFELAKKGFDVTGLDLSCLLVKDAKQHELENLQFFQHDIRLPFWINYFDYAFNLFSNFGHYKTIREHDNAIRVISQSLKTAGLFVLDYINVHFEEEHIEKNTEKLVDNQHFFLTKWQDAETFYTQIQLKQADITRELYTDRSLKLSIGDFTDMFAYQGLQIQEVFGDYNFADYNIRTSPRLIIIARKIRR